MGLVLKMLMKMKKSCYPSVLWKYGVNEKLELRLISEFTTHTDNSISTNGINPIKIGFKTRLFEEKGIIPVISFIAHLVILASGSKEFQTNYFAPSFRFTMKHTLTDKISLGYNWGAEWDGETPEPHLFIL